MSDGLTVVNFKVNPDSGAVLFESSNDYLIDLALGNILGFSVGTKFGRNSNIDIGTTPEDIWHGGGNYTGQPENFTPETVDVFSANANDTAAGTGARTIRIFGLKTNSSEVYESEDITLNGTSTVTSTNSWWRVNRAYVLTAGSTGSAQGDITIRSTTTTANVFAGEEYPAGSDIKFRVESVSDNGNSIEEAFDYVLVTP